MNISVECPKIKGEVASEWFDNSCWEGNTEAEISFAKTTDSHKGQFAQRVEIKNKLVNIGRNVKFESNRIYKCLYGLSISDKKYSLKAFFAGLIKFALGVLCYNFLDSA